MNANAKQVTLTTPAADPAHPSHRALLLAAILAAFQATEPIIINLIPPQAQLGVEIGADIAPIVISTIAAVEASKTA